MKKFTCAEMGGPKSCEVEFEADTIEEISKTGGKHVMTSSDDAHKKVRDQMENSSQKEKDKWMGWFRGEWDKKADK